ncbi:FHA domain-containing protein [Nocardioides sp.]|uniref:FHA domain-containing protein n=1 Tax=Nocardioides sp. TaxID=35761 RepID=UPI002B27BFDE|nr:FHA domain-containing protein [Nocardioides sp.]
MTPSTHRSSYRPGAWFGVFGSATTLLLPESEKTRVATLWSLIDDDAVFDEVLDALLEAGLGSLPGFLLVGHEEPTKILARGPVRLTGTAGGEEFEIDGSTALTWVERVLDTVDSLVAEVGGPSDHAGEEGVDDSGRADDLPIIGGLVRVSRVDRPAAVEAPVVPPAEVEEEATELVDLDEASGSSDDAGSLDRPIDLPEAGWPPPVGPPSAPLFVDDPLSAPLPSVPEQADDHADDHADDPTSDHDGLTRTGTLGPEVSRELPGIPGQPAPPRVVASVATLRFSTGEVVDVDRVVLIGRAPEARRVSASEQPRLVKVHSPLYEISSTHVEVRPGSGADHGTAVVTDLGSTNGTVLDQPGVGAESLRPGIAVQLIPGATINLGDGVSIQVTRP